MVQTKWCRLLANLKYIMPSDIYRPKGAFSGSTRTERIKLLLQAYWKNFQVLVAGIRQAIAKTIAEYKDVTKSGSHSDAYKNCFVTPSSLTTALISAVD